MTIINFQSVSTHWSDWHKVISDRLQEFDVDLAAKANLSCIHQSAVFQFASIHELIATRITPMASPIIRIHFEHLALFSLLLLVEPDDDIHQQFVKTNDDAACKEFYWKNFSNKKKVVYTRLSELHKQVFSAHKQKLDFEPVNYKMIAEDFNLALGKYVHPSLIAGMHSALNRRNLDELQKAYKTDASSVDFDKLSAMERDSAQIDAFVVKRFLYTTSTFSRVIAFKFIDDTEVLQVHRAALELTQQFIGQGS